MLCCANHDSNDWRCSFCICAMRIAIQIQKSNGVSNVCKYDRGSWFFANMLHVNHFQLNGIQMELTLGKRWFYSLNSCSIEEHFVATFKTLELLLCFVWFSLVLFALEQKTALKVEIFMHENAGKLLQKQSLENALEAWIG